MLWFKHAHDLRNSPAMKYIQRELSDEGFAAAIRLIEVLTYRCGIGTRFNPVLTLAVPTTKTWLAREILTYSEMSEDDIAHYSLEKHLDSFLKTFETAGLIELGELDGTIVGTNTPHKVTTIKLVEFEEFMDVWTARKRKDAQREPPPTA